METTAGTGEGLCNLVGKVTNHWQKRGERFKSRVCFYSLRGRGIKIKQCIRTKRDSMSYFQSLRHALFASRIKATHLRSQRCRGAVAKRFETRLETLEKRIALDASGDAAFQRQLLTQNHSIYLYPGEDASQGPLPAVFGKSDIVGNKAESFIVTGVVNGVVEKWDAASKTWQDVSTTPTSSNPRELLRLLMNRHVGTTDRVRWVPESGTRTAAPSHAFTSLAWNTGSETDSDCPETTVAYVSSSVQASGSANGDMPVSAASQTTEITCDCGCAPKTESRKPQN